MTKAEAKKIIADVLKLMPSQVTIGPRGIATVSCSMRVSYDQLVELSTKLGTRAINFEAVESDPGYSEETPGHPGSFELSIQLPEES